MIIRVDEEIMVIIEEVWYQLVIILLCEGNVYQQLP